jgi:DNA-binding NtrC family response regulator
MIHCKFQVKKESPEKPQGRMAKRKESFEMEEAIERDFAAEESRSTNASILVVDDNQAMRTVLCALLSIMGFQVTQAADGHEALDLISRKKFGVVLTDFEMPGMDGFTLSSNIKSSSPKTSVIMMTGSDRRVVQERMRNGCVDSILFKPFKLEDIDESLQGALTRGFASYATGHHLGEAQRGERNEKLRT